MWSVKMTVVLLFYSHENYGWVRWHVYGLYVVSACCMTSGARVENTQHNLCCTTWSSCEPCAPGIEVASPLNRGSTHTVLRSVKHSIVCRPHFRLLSLQSAFPPSDPFDWVTRR